MGDERRRLHIGVTAWDVGLPGTADQFARQAERVESLGLDSFWLPEFHFDDSVPLPQPLLPLAAVAARTRRPADRHRLVPAPRPPSGADRRGGGGARPALRGPRHPGGGAGLPARPLRCLRRAGEGEAGPVRAGARCHGGGMGRRSGRMGGRGPISWSDPDRTGRVRPEDGRKRRRFGGQSDLERREERREGAGTRPPLLAAGRCGSFRAQCRIPIRRSGSRRSGRGRSSRRAGSGFPTSPPR